MPDKDYIEELGVQAGHELEQSEIDEVTLWQNGRELSHIVNTPGWEVVIATLDAQAEAAAEQLWKLFPGDPAVPCAHAAASAAIQIVRAFKQAVSQALEGAKTIPEVLKKKQALNQQ